MNKSEKNASGEIIRGIEKIGEIIGNKSIATTMSFINLYDLPAKRTKDGAGWELDLNEFRKWAEGICWTPTMSESELRVQLRKKSLVEAGPGKVIEAKSLDAMAKRLFTDIGRIQDYRKQTDCPIQKNDDGTFSVDLNKWELFQIEHKVGPYLLTGKRSKGRIAWN
jgi:hypothetical protein